MKPTRLLHDAEATTLVHEIPGMVPESYSTHYSVQSPLTDFRRILRRHRQFIWTSVVVCLALSVAVCLLVTPKYESVTRIEVNHKSSDVLGLEDNLGSSDTLDSYVGLQTETQVLQSDTLALQVIQQTRLENGKGYSRSWWQPSWLYKEETAEAWLPLERAPARRARLLKTFKKNLSVKNISGTRLLEIKFLDPDPQMAADVANALVSSYLQQYYNTRFLATKQASDWLSKQLLDLKSDVEESQQRLVGYQKQAGILGTDEAHNVVTAKLEDLNKQVTAAEANRIIKGAVYELAKSGNPELIAGMEGRNIVTSGSGPSASMELLQNLRSQEAELRGQRANALAKYGAAYPRVLQLDSQLQDLKSSIDAEIAKTAQRAEADYRAAVDTERGLRNSFEDQKGEANRLNSSAIQYTILKHEVESSRDLYDDLLKKLKEAGVLGGLRSSNISIVDVARSADEPAKPKLPVSLALGLLAGLIVGVGIAFVIEAVDKKLYTPDEVELKIGLPTLGMIPDHGSKSVSKFKFFSRRRMNTQPYGKVPALADPQSITSEGYRSLRSAICLPRECKTPKIILVTSSVPEEGKSFTSLNLAVVLAQQNTRVLLVDADMRRGVLHKMLNIRSTPGLSALLSGKSSEESSICFRPGTPNLSVLPSGERPIYPAELLASARMKELITKWRDDYDFIIIDSPPLLSVTDAVVLAEVADSSVIVARSGQTDQQTLLHARNILLRARAHVTGVVLNAVDFGSPQFEDYSGYRFKGKYRRFYGDTPKAS